MDKGLTPTISRLYEARPEFGAHRVCMKHVKKSVLLWYTAHEMYELVVDVEAYPRFLPWCERVEVLERDDAGSMARLFLAYSGIRHAFTTRNAYVPDESVHISLVDGPFSLLDGHWRFVSLSLPTVPGLSLIHISEPTRRTPISYAVFCLKKKKTVS